MEIAVSKRMECFFGASDMPEFQIDGKTSIVMFHIPEVGIRFKAPFTAVDEDHSDLASLLALLEFIDSNQKYFSNHTFQIYGGNLNIINQVNGRMDVRDDFTHLLEKTNRYREKYGYSLDWCPKDQNSAFESLLD